MLKQGRCKIVNSAASSALKGKANNAAYAASKSAVARLTKSMAVEDKRQEINVNVVLPGTLDTLLNRQAMPQVGYGLWVTTTEPALVILFLASEDANPIHGALIPVFGNK
jgi:NAD(P)-dependent dehydrogenase (short-subunit alcohol dehydrogenase family)